MTPGQTSLRQPLSALAPTLFLLTKKIVEYTEETTLIWTLHTKQDGGQQGLETQQHKPGPLTGLREGLTRAQEAGGPKGPTAAHKDRYRPSGEDVQSKLLSGGPPRQTPDGGVLRECTAESEDS